MRVTIQRLNKGKSVEDPEFIYIAANATLATVRKQLKLKNSDNFVIEENSKRVNLNAKYQDKQGLKDYFEKKIPILIEVGDISLKENDVNNRKILLKCGDVACVARKDNGDVLKVRTVDLQRTVINSVIPDVDTQKQCIFKSQKSFERIYSDISSNTFNFSGGVSFGIAMVASAKLEGEYSKHNEEILNEQNYSKQDHFVESLFSIKTIFSLATTYEDIHLAETAKDALNNLFEKYKQFGKTQKFKPFLFNFLEQFGYTIDVGIYSFGGVYIKNKSFEFSSNATTKDKRNARNQSYKIKFEASGQKGIYSGSVNMEAGNSMRSEVHTVNKGASSQYDYRESITATPLIDNVEEWRKALASNIDYWKLIKTDITRVPIDKILNNKHNKIQHPSYEQFIEFIAFGLKKSIKPIKVIVQTKQPKIKQVRRRVALKACNGRYVSIMNGRQQDPLIAMRDEIGSWETFTLIQNVQGCEQVVALLSKHTGKYVCTELGGEWCLLANKQKIGVWERFTMIKLGGSKVAFRSFANNQYVCALDAGNKALWANQPVASTWETFELVQLK